MTRAGQKRPQAGGSMPVIFLAHGSPLLLDDASWVAELARWARALPRPESILIFSAHWEQRPVTLGATRTVPLPTFKGDATTSSTPSHSSAKTAPTISIIESRAPTSCRCTLSTVVP